MLQKAYKKSLVDQQTPQFIKMSTTFQNLRKQSFQIQMTVCTLLKERGNKFYQMNDIQTACQIYEELYQFLEFREFKNNTQYLVQYNGKSPEEMILLNSKTISIILELKIAILNNISATYLKLQLYQQTVEITTYVLNHDPNSPKALFRRGKALLSLSPLTNENLFASIEDLQKAQQIQTDQLILSTYQQAIEIMNKRQLNQINLIENANLTYEIDYSKEIPQEINEVKQFTEKKGIEMLKDLQKQGKIKEANEFLQELNQIQEAKKQLEKISRLNFDKPKPYLNEMIKRLGVNSIQLQQEFKKIQYQNLQDIRNKLKQWNYCYSKDLNINNQGLQGEQQEYPSENQTQNILLILGGLLIFILIGVFAAGT
ncbi:unnamed protein product (macronuclear) [Paramecium tetraurelia]|uniref:Uncharacterized protein n=1 Tax=Paramecium tetraurelia TaxID=5888 RepID=A0CZM8_PARTE|nr:uncharacterized protein GSPATT00011818001 [Paramecium tetraurelia]CAK76245.1 unnamed protein product [Paramecium tetraurelia]|eukprot:XP_001443642.1 hypothetical protein (macronuclear) [Paramecium tetraurelia strain d4-2]